MISSKTRYFQEGQLSGEHLPRQIDEDADGNLQ